MNELKKIMPRDLFLNELKVQGDLVFFKGKVNNNLGVKIINAFILELKKSALFIDETVILKEINYNNSTNSVLDAIIANVNSLYKNSGIQSFFTNYASNFVGGGPALGNSYSGGAQSTNSIAIHNLSPVVYSTLPTDLAGSGFLTYNSTGPFSTNFIANDTLYYEARLWFESGHSKNSSFTGSNGKNLYATLPEALAFYILNIE